VSSSNLAADIEHEEGREHNAYPDPGSPLGKACAAAGLAMRDYQKVAGWKNLSGEPWTIGVGCTGAGIKQGVTWNDAQIDSALDGRIQGFLDGISASDTLAPAYAALDPVRQDPLVQMCFQMGVAGVEGFPTMLGCIVSGDMDGAAAAGLDSKWARSDSPARARREMYQLKNGVRVWGDPQLAQDVGSGKVPV
jgi:GH24 family phage-related lysozyme (muramidase)